MSTEIVSREKILAGVLPLLGNLSIKSQQPVNDSAALKIITTDTENIVAHMVLLDGPDDYRMLSEEELAPVIPQPQERLRQSLKNLGRIIADRGLTVSAFPVEDMNASFWSIDLRQGEHSRLSASILLLAELMQTLEKKLEAQDGLIAVAPSCDRLLVSTDTDEKSVVELGLLGRHLQEQALSPLSTLIWMFRDGSREGIKAMEVE